MIQSKRRARIVLGGLLTVSAMVAALIVPNVAANAVPGSGGQNLTTNAPDLRTATLDSNGFVHYCYDGFVSTAVASDLDLVGMDSDLYSSSASAAGTKIDSNDPHCILADFTGEDAPSNYTRAYSYNGAATDSNGNVNADDSAPLQGTIVAPVPGVSDTPLLTHATTNTALNRISYYYDKNLTGGIANTNWLGYYTSAGLTGSGSNHFADATCSIASAGDHINCDFPNTDNVSQAVAAVDDEEGAVDTNNNYSALNAVPINTAGDGQIGTGSPDLMTVTKVGNKTYDFKFDSAVTPGTDSEFGILLDDGTVYTGDGHSQPANDTIRETFNGADDDPAHVVRGEVYESGVQNLNGDDNTEDSLALSTPDAGPGVTDGPDLQRASYDTTNNAVTYTFDENVLDSSVTAGDFDLISNTGDDYASGSTIIDVSGPTVTIGFSSGVAQAAGTVAQDSFAVCDTVNKNSDENYTNEIGGGGGPFDCTTGNGNSLNAVGGGPAAPVASPTSTPSSTTTASPTSTGTGQPSPTSSPSHQPVTRDDQTNLSLTYGGGIFSGNATDGDSSANCEGGRLVQLHKKRRHHSGHVVGSDTTDGSGHYSIAHRARRHRHRRRRLSYWTTIDASVVTASNGDTVNCLATRSNTTIRR